MVGSMALLLFGGPSPYTLGTGPSSTPQPNASSYVLSEVEPSTAPSGHPRRFYKLEFTT
jgi:hypothetical protein